MLVYIKSLCCSNAIDFLEMIMSKLRLLFFLYLAVDFSFASEFYSSDCRTAVNVKRIFNVHQWLFFEETDDVGRNIYWMYDNELHSFIKADWLYSLMSSMLAS